MTAPGWRDRAACRGMDPEVFYATDNTGLARAKRICGGCPVAVECLREAMRLEAGNLSPLNRHGVWGGTSPRLRSRLAVRVRDQRRAAAGVAG